MSIRMDGSGERASRTTSLPSQTAFTMAGFCKRVTNRGTFENVCGLENASSSAGNYQELIFSGSTFYMWTGNNGGVAFGAAPSDGEWFFFAIVCSGTGANQCNGYWCTLAATTLNSALNQNNSMTPAFMVLGSSSYDEWLDGNFAGVKVWDAALTEAELLLEVKSLRAVRRENLHLETPQIAMTIGDNVTDFSGNGRDWTHGGTLVVEQGPPVSWDSQKHVNPTVTASGTTVTPSAVTIAMSTPAPSIALGALTVTPNAVTIAMSTPTPAIALGALTTTPSPVVIGLATQDPAVALGALTTIPDPVVVSVAISAPTVINGGAVVVTPNPVTVSMSMASPAIQLGVLTVTPDPVTVSMSTATPSLALLRLVTPDPVTIGLSIPTPALSFGALVVTPSPVIIALATRSPSITGGGGGAAYYQRYALHLGLGRYNFP